MNKIIISDFLRGSMVKCAILDANNGMEVFAAEPIIFKSKMIYQLSLVIEIFIMHIQVQRLGL